MKKSFYKEIEHVKTTRGNNFLLSVQESFTINM